MKTYKVKFLIILLISTLFFNCSNNVSSEDSTTENNEAIGLIKGMDVIKDANNDLKKMGIKGDVKSFTQLTFLAKEHFEEVEKGEITKHLAMHVVYKITNFEYNFEFLQKNNFSKFNNLKKTFDSNGNMVEKFLYDIEDNEWYLNRKLRYDSNGDIIDQDKYNKDDGLFEKLIWKYDSNGKVEEKKSYAGNGRLFGRYTYLYDSNGNMIEESYYSHNGFLVHNETFLYDSHGNIIEKKFYQPELARGYTYEYSNNGKLMSARDIKEYKEYIFYQDSVLIYKNYPHIPKIREAKITYKYDNNGNIIEIDFHEVGNSMNYKRLTKYDDKGNWVELTFYNGLIPVRIIERTFEYN